MKTTTENAIGKGMRAKLGIICTVLMAAFLYQGIIRPLIGDTATKTYYFTLDSTSVNLGVDGNTNTFSTRNGKISMKTGVYTRSRSVTAASNTSEQNMIRAYGPAYASKQTLTAPVVTIGVRDRNGTSNNIYWKAYIYDYNPAGAANNGVLLWTSDEMEAHPSVQTPLEFTFTAPAPKDIDAGHRIKIVITCRMASAASSGRLYWGGGSNYSFFTVTEAPYVANSLTVSNLSDYYGGALTSITQGDGNVAMLQFDMYSNVAGGASWTGGKLDKIGSNSSTYVSEDEPGDASFKIYRDANGDGKFTAAADTLIGGPYTFSQLTGQTYSLATAQTITASPVRYFIVYDILRYATYNTTVGARIADSSYFTVTGASGGIVNVTSTSSSQPVIQYGGTAITKTYHADWDLGTSLAGISESGGPGATDSACIVRNTAGSGFPLVGLLNYPVHTCTSVAGQGYSTTTAQADFIRLYFAGAGYRSAMKTIKGGSFVYRVYTPSSGGTVTLRLFYVTAAGVRVNAPTSATYTTSGSFSQTVTTSLAGQDFSNVPAGARLGIQIGVTANMRIGLGGAVGARLTVQETAAENENVDVGNGATIANANVYASDTNKLINGFTLSAAKAKTVNSITVTGSPMFNSTNVKEVRIYADTGTTVDALDAGDPLVGSTSTISGNSATVSGLALAAGTATKKYLVTASIGDNPNTNVVLTAVVSDLDVAVTGGIGVNTDTASATLTILPTTVVSDFIAAEPADQIIPWNAGKTKVDAFGLKTNGGLNDTISSVTVALITTSTLPADKVISDYIGRVDIVNAAGTSLGHLTAPTQDDDWQVTTSGLVATPTGTDYYVAVTPKGNQSITFTVKAMVISVVHSRSSNKLLVSDPGSATVTLDQHAPTEPSLTAATGIYHNDADRAEIDLNWTASTDSSGSAVTYKLVRGLGNAPPPRSCATDGVKSFLVYQGAALSHTEKGLEEGVSYGYRVCAIDSVANITTGSANSAIASIKNRCDELPELRIDPINSYVTAGNSTEMSVGVINKDTGVCAPTTFTLSIVGGDPDDENFTASHFDESSFILPTNRGSKYTHLHVTAKPGAAEMASRTFHVKVAKSSGGEVQCPTPVLVTVNRNGTMMHSSMQLGTAKYGSWGVDYNCSTCHSPTATNLKQVKNLIATPTGNRPVSFSIVSTAHDAVVDGVYGNDRRTGTATTHVCEVCHHRARFHQYSAAKITWKDHNNNSDCMKCHPHGSGFKSVGAAGACDDCHGNPPSSQAQLVVPPTDVLYPSASNAGSHPKHDARQVKCQACHSNGNHIVAANPLGDKKLNMGFSIKDSNFTGFVGHISSATMRALPAGNDYTWQTAAGTAIQQAPNTVMTCNVYCHGWEDNGGYNTEPAWTGITQVGCGSCHAAAGDVPPTSGSHRKHGSTDPGFGNGIACSKCHGFRNYSTSSAHINGVVEWNLSAITPTALYRGVNSGSTGSIAPTPPGNYGSCANLYCHSNVVQPNNNGVGAPTVFSNPTWGGTTNCNSCHQAEPNNTGGHPQHAGEEVTGFDCRICHANGGSTNPLNHADSRINFTFTGLGENTHYSYSSAKTPGTAPYGSCYNGNCHGARRTLAWGPQNASVPLCEKCHTTSPAPSGFYSTSGPESTTADTDRYVGAHFQHITSMPYRYSAKMDCSACHYKPTGPYTPGHIDSALPAEINFSALAGSGAQNGYTSAAHVPAYDYGAAQCSNIWCHGAGMASNEGTGAYGSAALDGGALGSPAAAVWNTPFLTGVGTNDCVKCHAFPPAAPLPGYTHWDDNNARPYIANQCVLCHKHLDNDGYTFKNPTLHVNGVVDSCNTCHGRPPIDEAGVTVPATGALTPGLVGAHQAHALNPSIGKDCNVCHYNYNLEMPSYQMEIGFNAFGGKVSRGTFWGYSTLSDNYTPRIVYFSTRTSSTVRRTNDVTMLNTCENLYCHGGGTGTLPPLGGGSNAKPNWELGSTQAECGSCHGVTGDTYRARGSHGAHVGTGFGEPKLGCSNCHGIKVNNYHVDGKVEWEFYSTAKRLNETAGYAGTGYQPAGGSSFANSGFAQNLAPSASWGTCQVYCHSDGKGNYASPLPTWGGPAMNCGSCHKNQTSAFSGSHEKHSKSSALGGYGIDCLICHYGSGSGSALHVNGAFDIVFNTGVVGSSATWDGGSKQCFSILCHDSTVATGPTWGVAGTGNYDTGTYKPTCIGCHSGEVGGRAAVVPQFAGESHHYQGAEINNSVCYPCHMEANANGTANTTYHDRTAGKPVDLMIWSTGVRGAVFTRYTANGNVTHKRTEYLKLNNHCLGCHNAANGAITPFGDGLTPKQYAWDGTSVAERYSIASTTPWAKVTGNNTITKNQTKAYSAHGRADLNQRGWQAGDTTTGETYNNASGTVNVLCFDCHNSHGTNASGIMSSYSSLTGRYKGGILKSTVENVGGYSATYVPVAGGDSAAPNKNAYTPGAALCFDCHNNATAGATVPWGYNSTFGSSQPIYGYHDKPYFGDYTSCGTARTASYRSTNATNKGGHFGRYTTLATTPTKRINGLCTPCHDPHGLSPATPANQPYMVPLLKGTWVTSPYKQDTAPGTINETRGGGREEPAINVGSTAGYRIDQNTMGIAAGATRGQWTFPNNASGQTPSQMQSTTESQFAGLCLGCHNKADINNTADASTTNWKTMKRIHNSVKGWATATGGNANNSKHAFTCSKCHTPHNAGLPRLLVTNCLDVNHRGRVTSGGSMSAVESINGRRGDGAGRFPQGGGGTGVSPKTSAGKWFFGKTIQSTSIASTSQTLCHESGTAGGTYNGGMEQKWNNLSPW